VESLLAELVELQLSGEVLPDNILGFLQHRRFVNIPVDLGEHIHFI